jgi:hypothetical protein
MAAPFLLSQLFKHLHGVRLKADVLCKDCRAVYEQLMGPDPNPSRTIEYQGARKIHFVALDQEEIGGMQLESTTDECDVVAVDLHPTDYIEERIDRRVSS